MAITLKIQTGFNFYTIPDLCHCGCGTILYHRGQRYVSGHDSKYHVWNKGITQSEEHKRKTLNHIKVCHPEIKENIHQKQ